MKIYSFLIQYVDIVSPPSSSFPSHPSESTPFFSHCIRKEEMNTNHDQIKCNKIKGKKIISKLDKATQQKEKRPKSSVPSFPCERFEIRSLFLQSKHSHPSNFLSSSSQFYRDISVCVYEECQAFLSNKQRFKIKSCNGLFFSKQG